MNTFARRKRPGYAAIGTPMHVACRLPFRIAPGVSIRKARASEIVRIKEYLRSLGGHKKNSEAFESEYSRESDASVTDGVVIVSHQHKPLAEADWRYLVVALRDCPFSLAGDLSELSAVRLASHLTGSPVYLNPLFTRRTQTSDFTADWEHYPNIAIDGGSVFCLTNAFLSDWKKCFDLVVNTRSAFPEIWHSAQLYQEIPARHGQHQLTTLALFAVLESLLTHAPQGEVDSISRQIRTKIALLEKRLAIPIDYSAFGEARSETLWKRLYELRSRIAHGAPVTFEKQFVILDDQVCVERFMWKTVRSLLRGAMTEPDLYADLKLV